MQVKCSRLLTVLISAVLLNVATTASGEENMVDLATASGCFICHSIAPDPNLETPLAPSYQDIAARYRDKAGAFDTLLDRVLHGTVYREQNWEGKVSMRFMPPNVNVMRPDAMALVDWILSQHGESPITDELKQYESMVATATTNGCMTCHNVSPLADARAVPLAPSFREIAAYYDGQDNAHEQVIESVQNGTVNKPKVWENVNMRFMPPNVALREADTAMLVDWILGLDHQGVKVHPKTSDKPAQ